MTDLTDVVREESHPHQYDGNPWMALVIVLFGTVMVVLDTTIVNVALPQIRDSLNAGNGIEWVVSAYLLAVASSQPASGWLADRFGRKLIFLSSLAAFTAASLLAALAPNLAVLVLCRVLQGLGGGALLPVGMAIILEVFPRAQHGRAMSTWGVATMAAPAIGPTFGGWLVSSVSWHWLFFINVPIGVVGVVLGMKTLPRFGHQERRPFDFLGTLLGGGGLALSILGLSEANSWGWTSLSTIGCISVGLVALALFVQHELRCPNPMIELRIFKRRAFTLSTGITFLLGCASYARLVFIPLQLEGVRGYSALSIGLLLAPAAITTAVFMKLGGLLVDRIQPKWPALAGSGLIIVAMLCLSRLTLTTPLWLIGTFIAFQGAGVGIGMAPLLIAGMSDLPSDLIARGSAVRSLANQIAGAIAVAALGALVSAKISANATAKQQINAYNTAFFAMALVMIGGVVMASRLPRTATSDVDKDAAHAAMLIGE
ncbi:MAG: DHA2 family efflux MFS transporter permease subunit [Acidimicrobiia bacterium]